MSIRKVLDEALERISPGKKAYASLLKIASDVLNELSSAGFRAVLGGSLAKGTLALKGEKQDVDVFVIFEREEDTRKLLDLKKALKKFGELKVVHGSRDYLRINAGISSVEIVPVVEVKKGEPAENVTDYSVYHVNYVKSKIEKTPRLADEILLAKAFCRAQGFYGAESYIKGFSGYSLELLIIYYGDFENFLRKVGKEKVIDIEGHFKSPSEALFEINSAKLISPFVLIDPVYKYRNAAAGLSKDTFEEFKLVSSIFLKEPSVLFFKKPLIDKEYVKKMDIPGASFFEIAIESSKGEGDVAGAKCRRFFDIFSRELERGGQKIGFKKFFYPGEGNVARGYFRVFERKEVESMGPLDRMAEEKKRFLEKNPQAYKKGSRWYVKRKSGFKEVLRKVNSFSENFGASGRVV